MTARDRDGGFAARPCDAHTWIKPLDPSYSGKVAADLYTARLTVDITPAFRGCIEIAAFRRGR